MLTRIRRGLFVLLAAVLLPLCTHAESVPDVVRVGVYESNGFIALDEHDKMTGYGAEFMERLAEYANVTYRYVRLTWKQCMEQLLSGEIDIVTDARRSAEREILYDFSVQNIGQIQAAIFVPKSQNDFYFNDYAALNGLRVGFEEGALNLPLYQAFARQHGFKAVTVEYPATSDLRIAMERGEIDAFGGDTHVYTEDLKVVSIYNTDPNYIMAAKNSPVMKRLNLAIERMFSENPEMIVTQYNSLANRQTYGDILLTREEAAYVAEHPKLRVATFPNRKPASWYDPSDDTFKGIAVELMEKLSQVTGIEFEYVAADVNQSAVYMLAQDDIDLAIPAINREVYNELVPVRITNPLYSLSAAMAVTNASRGLDEDGFTVAVARSNQGIRQTLDQSFDNLTFREYDSTQDCVDALKLGDVDAYANAMYELEYMLKSPRNENLRLLYSFSCPIDYCIAMNADAPDELYHILNSGIALLTQREIDRVTRYYTTFLKYDDTLADRIYENRHMLVGLVLLLLVITGCWTWYSQVQRRAMDKVAQKGEEARHAAEEARRANAAKSDFLARISHDMRTPMNGILGLAELSKDMEMSSEARGTIAKIDMEGRFLLSLINDTLDMSKIESNKLTLNEQPVDAQQALEDTLALVQAYAKERKVHCTVRQHDVQRGLVLMDKLRVQQIILNILSNAVKFSPEGGTVELYLECYKRQDDMAYDKFVISDHGIGMSPEFLPKLFDPFEQENDQTIAVQGGSGLGMSITKRLVEMMGGRIEVQSTKNVGTTVTVYLAFRKCAAGQTAAVEPLAPMALEGAHVLLCEDNEINTLVAKGLLQKGGCIVDCAKNGQEGVACFQASSPGEYRVILMDIRMPIMDGLAATRAIRQLDREDAKTIPIVALTANAFEEDMQHCLDAGMNAHISKPIDIRTLYRTLAEVCR